MVKAATLEVEIGAKIDQFEKSLGKVRKDLGGMEKRLTGVSRGASKASTAFSGMARRLIAVGAAYFGARGIFKMGKSFLDVASSVETYRLRLEAMLGSQEAATDAMAFFKDVAAKVPFTLEEVIEAGVKVQAFGADLKAWSPIMADLAAFMGVTLPEAASALGRAFAGGAGAADIFRERGILQVIKDFARMERGIDDITKISLPEFRDVMYEAFAGAESKVAGTADKLATTWTGIVSMLQDKWFKFRDAVMKAKVFEILKEGLKSFNAKLDEFVESGKLEEWASDTAIGILGFMQAVVHGIGGVLTVIHGFQAAVFEMASLVTKHLMNQVGVLVKAFTIAEKLVPGLRGATDKLADLWLDLKYITEGYKGSSDEQVEATANVIENIEKLIEKLRKAREEVEKSKGSTSKLAEKTEKFGETIVETVLPPSRNLAAALEDLHYKTETLHFAIVGLSERGMLMFGEMTNAFAGGLMNALDAFERFGEEGGNIFETLGEAMHGFISAAIDALKRFVMEIITSAATTIFAKQAEAIAGMIASVMTAIPFPFNLLLVGGAIAAVTALFAGLKPKKYETGGYVPQETFAHLHAGERVLSASEVRRGVGAGAGGGITINVSPVINIAAMDSLGVRDFMRNRGMTEIVDAINAGIQKPEFKKALGVG